MWLAYAALVLLGGILWWRDRQTLTRRVALRERLKWL